MPAGCPVNIDTCVWSLFLADAFDDRLFSAHTQRCKEVPITSLRSWMSQQIATCQGAAALSLCTVLVRVTESDTFLRSFD